MKARIKTSIIESTQPFKNKEQVLVPVKNRIAETLEEKGLWRRAATCWLAVMQHCHTGDEQDWVRRRRNYCLSHLKRSGNNSKNVSGVEATDKQLKGNM